ncbi:MAG: hypothetical protein KY464_11420 [Gemmatimonadetes bacterium]|nr:hypothetical protein [Gemmatimonadota bacterium]
MKTTAFVTHSDCSLHDTGWAHPEHQGRLPAVARAVYRDMLTLFEPLLEVEAVPACDGDLLLAHSREYVDRIRERSSEAAAAGEALPFEGGTRISGASWAAATAAVGAALTAAQVVLGGQVRNAFCAVRPPGHGAGVSSSRAYALFNPVAVAALALRRRHGVARVLIVEVGARPGLGTYEIVDAVPGIEFVSVHADGEPLEAAGSSERIIAVPAGSGGESMLAALTAALDHAFESFPPDFLLMSLGCDALGSETMVTL